MTIHEYLKSSNNLVSFFPVFIYGEFDSSGTITYLPHPETGLKPEEPRSIYNLLADNTAKEYLETVLSGTKSGNMLFNLNTPKKTKIIWEYQQHKNKLHYLFRAYPIEKSSLFNIIKLNGLTFSLISTLPDLIIITRISGEIIYINPSGIEILNRNDSLISRDNIRNIITNIDNFDLVLERINRGEVIQEIEFSFKRNNMEDLIGLSSVFSISQYKEQFIFFHVIDISDRVKSFSLHMKNSILLMNVNEELKRTQTQLINQEKMASVGQLSAGLAHELNNPLGYVFNNITVLFNYMNDIQNFVKNVRELYSIESLSSPKLDQIKMLDKNIDLDFIFNDFNDLKEETTEGVTRIKSLIDSLRSFSEDESITGYSLNNINNSIKDTLVILVNEYKYSINIKTEYGNLPEILSNHNELNQAFLNIIRNAIEAIKDDTHIKNGNIIIKTYADEKAVNITIYNDGPAIPGNVINRIFEPFFSTKPIGEGTGLGLSIAHDIIVNKHNGTLKVENLETGVLFHLTIPFEEELYGES